jgi:hypothetical protein
MFSIMSFSSQSDYTLYEAVEYFSCPARLQNLPILGLKTTLQVPVPPLRFFCQAFLFLVGFMSWFSHHWG